MIELTPLDVRKKRGDFRRTMRGFEPAEVDAFLELVAERMESLVKENMTLKERAARLADQVREQQVREKAVQDALVTAQELRKDISGQAQREAELIKREAEAEIERMLLDAESRADSLQSAMAELERRRRRFIKGYQQMLERELDAVQEEATRHPLQEKPLELELPRVAAAVVEEKLVAAPDAGTDSGDADPSGTPDPAISASEVTERETDLTLGAEAGPDPNAVPVDTLAPETQQPPVPAVVDATTLGVPDTPAADAGAPDDAAAEPSGEEIPDTWGTVRPRLRTESGASDGF